MSLWDFTPLPPNCTTLGRYAVSVAVSGGHTSSGVSAIRTASASSCNELWLNCRRSLMEGLLRQGYGGQCASGSTLHSGGQPWPVHHEDWEKT